MDALRKLLGAPPAGAPQLAAESDDIYPVHMLDDTKSLRGIVVTWTLRFNDVLDAEKLHNSLSRLLEIGDWRKIGGRLRLQDNGELEIYVPQPFTAERPAVSFSHEALDLDIEDHPLGKTLPKVTEGPSIQVGPQGFQAFAARKDAPAILEDFVNHDTPQLSLHITSFKNATLVGLSWPHTLMDVMGQQALLRCWSLVLAGRESELPPLLGAREDPICAAADAPAETTEEFALGQKKLTGWSMVKFGARFAWDLMSNQAVEKRTIFLPKKAVAELRNRAQRDLANQDDGTDAPFISEGDVLTAWATRALASSLPQPRPVTVLHPLNARFRLSSLVQSPGLYVQNMAVAAFAFLSADVARGPLGPIALENRRHLMEQSTEAQVLAGLRELRQESKLKSDPTMVCGESDALLVPITNWTRADFFKIVDFGPAVVRAGDVSQSRTNPPGSMVYHHAHSMREGAAARNVVVVLGKDLDDNYWLNGILMPQTWAKIEEELRTL
ncbi:hypothetical protein GQ53DRAFT_687175 [Thozetella sp. PMI_491]|nr:hypothetical protein GQ53DRAFT_687175 [Thozetella sp. PMI_491]